MFWLVGLGPPIFPDYTTLTLDRYCLLLWRGTVFERAWINARGAIDLVTGDVGYANDRVAIGPVVAEALHSISKTINHSSPFTHPTDRSKVVTAL